MDSAIEAIDIVLDKPRRLRLDHAGLFRAECEINRIRGASPEERAGIDYLMVRAYSGILRSVLLPLDLLFCVLLQALLHEDPKLTFDDMPKLIEASPLTRGDISVFLWEAYLKCAGKNLRIKTEDSTAEAGSEEEEKKSASLASGEGNGASRSSS
jgi:hypothetical protein